MGCAESDVNQCGNSTWYVEDHLDGDAVAYQVDEKMEVLPSKLCQEFSGFTYVVRTLPNEQPTYMPHYNINLNFWTSPEHILLRECDFCIDSHRYIYYKRYTLLDSFDLFTSMHEWKSVDNHIGHDLISSARCKTHLRAQMPGRSATTMTLESACSRTAGRMDLFLGSGRDQFQ